MNTVISELDCSQTKRVKDKQNGSFYSLIDYILILLIPVVSLVTMFKL